MCIRDSVENGCIYWAIQELYKNGIETIDALNITNMLNSNNAVKKKIAQSVSYTHLKSSCFIKCNNKSLCKRRRIHQGRSY